LIIYGGGIGYRCSEAMLVEYLNGFTAPNIVNVGCELASVSNVVVDNYNSMKVLVRDVIKANPDHSIAILSGPPSNAESKARFEGCKDALIESGVNFDQVVTVNGDFTRLGGYKASRTLIETCETLPSLILCGNDISALGLMDGLKEKGIRIPEDVKITGYDDFEYAKVYDPPLTTVTYPAFELGKQAMTLLFNLLLKDATPTTQVVLGDHIFRTSCKGPDELKPTIETPAISLKDSIDVRDRFTRRSKFDYCFFRFSSPEEILSEGARYLFEGGIYSLLFFSHDEYDEASLTTESYLFGMEEDRLVTDDNVDVIAKGGLPKMLFKPQSNIIKNYCWILIPLIYDRKVLGHVFVQSHDWVREFSEHISLQFSGLLNRINLEERTRKLREQMILSERMASLGNMVGGIAHELNTPLSILKVMQEQGAQSVATLVAKLESGTLSPSELVVIKDEFNEAQRLSESNLQRAIHLVNSFKEVAVDQSIGDRREFNLFNYLSEFKQAYMHETKLNQISLDIRGPDNVLMNSFPGQLIQVLSNFLSNSIRYAFVGIESSEKTIGIHFHVPDGSRNVVIEFRDNGIGIESRHRNRIFDPFYTTGRNTGGSGLGLNIVFNLVTRTLQGTVKLIDTEVGSLFKIEVPQKTKVLDK
jgi:signal transduction histidine kinase